MNTFFCLSSHSVPSEIYPLFYCFLWCYHPLPMRFIVGIFWWIVFFFPIHLLYFLLIVMRVIGWVGGRVSEWLGEHDKKWCLCPLARLSQKAWDHRVSEWMSVSELWPLVLQTVFGWNINFNSRFYWIHDLWTNKMDLMDQFCVLVCVVVHIYCL